MKPGKMRQGPDPKRMAQMQNDMQRQMMQQQQQDLLWLHFIQRLTKAMERIARAFEKSVGIEPPVEVAKPAPTEAPKGNLEPETTETVN